MNELQLAVPVARGAKGADVKRIQEWLGLNGRLVSTDSDFGPATQAAVRLFQTAKTLPPTGVVDAATWSALVAPMTVAVANIAPAGKTVGALSAAWAEQQVVSGSREVGGQNRGPWVRLYMDGNEGDAFAWCAGFACFCLARACAGIGVPLPFKTSVGCDELAANARATGRFLGLPVGIERQKVTPGSLFLLKGAKAGDWTHTGVVTAADGDVVHTVEGNTNDDGSREGYEVCRRVRSYRSLDFALVD